MLSYFDRPTLIGHISIILISIIDQIVCQSHIIYVALNKLSCLISVLVSVVRLKF